MARPRRYPEELIERAVRLALESNRPIAHVAADLEMDGERLRRYVRQARVAGGVLPEPASTAERAEILRLRAEVAELERANEILKRSATLMTKSLSARTAPAQIEQTKAPAGLCAG